MSLTAKDTPIPGPAVGRIESLPSSFKLIGDVAHRVSGAILGRKRRAEFDAEGFTTGNLSPPTIR